MNIINVGNSAVVFNLTITIYTYVGNIWNSVQTILILRDLDLQFSNRASVVPTSGNLKGFKETPLNTCQVLLFDWRIWTVFS